MTYSINDTQSSHGCPCKKDIREKHITMNKHTTYVSYSAVNITVITRNAAGYSPPWVTSLQPVSTAGFTSMCVTDILCIYLLTRRLDLFSSLPPACEKTLLGKKLKKKTCLELYKFQDGDWRPDKVITSAIQRTHVNQSKATRTNVQ